VGGKGAIIFGGTAYGASIQGRFFVCSVAASFCTKFSLSSDSQDFSYLIERKTEGTVCGFASAVGLNTSENSTPCTNAAVKEYDDALRRKGLPPSTAKRDL